VGGDENEWETMSDLGARWNSALKKNVEDNKPTLGFCPKIADEKERMIRKQKLKEEVAT
jgi:hypothetical protein